MATAATLTRTATPRLREYEFRAPEAMDFAYVDNNNEDAAFERDAFMLYPYIMQGRISNGRAAEILGVSRWSLIEWYGSHGLTSLAFSIDEAEQDLAVMRELGIAD